MAKQVTKLDVLSIYKKLLRESQKFDSYNYRNYALRRIKESFRSNKDLQDGDVVRQQFDFANKNLAIVHRQVVIGKLYSIDKLVIENQGTAKTSV